LLNIFIAVGTCFTNCCLALIGGIHIQMQSDGRDL
jgi:hypothetical protein